jgi:HSP20 family protein
MVYATTTPTTPVFGLRREIDRLFEDAFRLGQAGRGDWSPAVDVREFDQELLFTVEIPGIAQKDVEVTTENGVLTVRGERTEERTNGEEGRYHLVERSYGSFIRRFQLPQGVDNEEIKAEIENGMLNVHVRKAALPQPKQIHITAAPIGSKHTQKVTASVASPAEAPMKGSETLQPE